MDSLVLSIEQAQTRMRMSAGISAEEMKLHISRALHERLKLALNHIFRTNIVSMQNGSLKTMMGMLVVVRGDFAAERAAKADRAPEVERPQEH